MVKIILNKMPRADKIILNKMPRADKIILNKIITYIQPYSTIKKGSKIKHQIGQIKFDKKSLGAKKTRAHEFIYYRRGKPHMAITTLIYKGKNTFNARYNPDDIYADFDMYDDPCFPSIIIHSAYKEKINYRHAPPKERKNHDNTSELGKKIYNRFKPNGNYEILSNISHELDIFRLLFVPRQYLYFIQDNVKGIDYSFMMLEYQFDKDESMAYIIEISFSSDIREAYATSAISARAFYTNLKYR